MNDMQYNTEPGTPERKQEIIAELDRIRRYLDGIFAAVNPKIYEGSRRRATQLEEELGTFYDDL